MKRLRNSGDHRKWSTIREQLSTHERTTIIFTDANEEIHHVRVSSMPESVYEEIYRLKIRIQIYSFLLLTLTLNHARDSMNKIAEIKNNTEVIM